MGSILVSRALALARRSPVEGPLAALRHDDVFALLAELPTRFPPPAWPWAAAILLSFLVGAALVSLAWAAAARVGAQPGKPRRAPAAGQDRG